MSLVEREPVAEGLVSEDLLVFDWRFQRSLQMGFRTLLAERIAATCIDLHDLEHLIGRGCPKATAYRILRS